MAREFEFRSFAISSDSSFCPGSGSWPLDCHEILLHSEDIDMLRVSAFGYVVVSCKYPLHSSPGSTYNADTRSSNEYVTCCRAIPDDAMAPGEVCVPSWIMRNAGMVAGEKIHVTQLSAAQGTPFPTCTRLVVSPVALERGIYDFVPDKLGNGQVLSISHRLPLDQAIRRRVAGCLARAGSLLAVELLGQITIMRVKEVHIISSSLDSVSGNHGDESVGPQMSNYKVPAGERQLQQERLGHGYTLDSANFCEITSASEIVLQGTEGRFTGSKDEIISSPNRQERMKMRSPGLNPIMRSGDVSPREALQRFDARCRGREVWISRAPSMEATIDELHALILLAVETVAYTGSNSVSLGVSSANHETSHSAPSKEHVNAVDVALAARSPPGTIQNFPTLSTSRQRWSKTNKSIGGSLGILDVLPNGIALCGPAGVGKTLALDVICEDLSVHHAVHIVRLLGPQVLADISYSNGGSRGEASSAGGTLLARALVEARDHAPAALVFDELDAIFDSLGGEREGALGEGARTGAALLAFLDDASLVPGVAVVGATRRSPRGARDAGWTYADNASVEGSRLAMPAAFLKQGRFDRFVEIGPPTQAGREGILRVLLGMSGWRLESLDAGRTPVVNPKLPQSVHQFPGGTRSRDVDRREGNCTEVRSAVDHSEQTESVAEWARRLSSVTPGMLAGDLDRLVRAMRTRVARRLQDLGQTMAPSAWPLRAKKATVQPGSLSLDVVTWQDAMGAVATIVPRALRGMDVTSPSVGANSGSGSTWASVGGFVKARQKLQRLVQWPWQHPEAFARMGISAPAGALLYGPSGCGKSLMAQVLAHECSANFVWVRSSELLSRYLGETEANLRALFARARAAAPCILFLDELDAITLKRGDAEGSSSSGGGSSGVHTRLLSTLLNEMDGVTRSTPSTRSAEPNSAVSEGRSVLVLAATNRREALDAALLRPGRLHESVELGMPDREDREGVLRIHANRLPLSAAVDLGRLSGDDVSGGLTCADLEASCRDAAMMALREDLKGACQVRPEHLRRALEARVAGRLKTKRFTFSLGQGPPASNLFT